MTSSVNYHDDPRRWWALGALALAVLTVGLDATIVNVALPTLATELHASTSQLQWIANAFNLVFAAALLPAGLLGDRYGRKRLLLGALVLFGLSSLACAVSGSAGQLIAARALLGLGGAALMPLSMAVLPVLFSDAERPKALATWVGATAIALPLGPIVGGVLLDSFAWGSIFLINVPVVLAALVAVALFVPESRGARAPRLDLGGIALSSAGLALVTYGAIEAGVHGWGDAGVLAELIGGVALLLAFAWWQLRVERDPAGQPLIDLALLRSRSFTWATLIATLVSFAMFGLLFAVPQYFQAVGGSDALGTGLKLLPVIGGLLVGARLADPLAPRVGAKALVAFGLALMAAGFAVGATSDAGDTYGFTAAWIGLIGVGIGFALPTSIDAALGELSPARAGVGSALIQACRQVGGVLGVALLGTVLASGYRDALDLGGLPATAVGGVRESPAAGVAVAHQLDSGVLLHSVRVSFVQGMDALLWVCVAATALGALLALAFLPRRSARAAERAELAHDVAA